MGNTMKRARSAETLRRTGEYTIANFYLNKIPSQPEGDFIDNIHDKWWGNYRKLEDHHGPFATSTVLCLRF
jgi:Opioid growth factor receptor (OGFr) conserved region